MLKFLNKIRTGTIIIIMLLITESIGITIGFKYFSVYREQKDIQINSLIAEIGELKNENLTIGEKNRDIAVIVNKIAQNMNGLSIAYEDLRTKTNVTKSVNETHIQEIAKINKELQTMMMSYQVALQQKEKEVIDKDQKISRLAAFNATNENKEIILLLGTRNGLSDTIIEAIIDPTTQKITLVSIPRDLYYNGRKINEYYTKYGIETLKDAAYNITGLKPSHYVVIDIEGLEEAIELLGGIEIEIPKDLVDDHFPDINYGYKTVEFKKGIELMTGSRLLEYVRTRKSTSDFDRINRQQAVLAAIKNKLLNIDVYGNLTSILQLYKEVESNMKSDLNIFDMLAIYENSKNMQINKQGVLHDVSLLISSTDYEGRYILTPRDGDYAVIQDKIMENL
jgi:LCP family protein required for cell wall assembly